MGRQPDPRPGQTPKGDHDGLTRARGAEDRDLRPVGTTCPVSTGCPSQAASNHLIVADDTLL